MANKIINIKFEKRSGTYSIYNCDSIYLGYIGKILEGELWGWCFYPGSDTEFKKDCMREILLFLEDPEKYLELN